MFTGSSLIKERVHCTRQTLMLCYCAVCRHISHVGWSAETGFDVSNCVLHCFSEKFATFKLSVTLSNFNDYLIFCIACKLMKFAIQMFNISHHTLPMLLHYLGKFEFAANKKKCKRNALVFACIHLMWLSNGGCDRNEIWQKGSLRGEDDAQMSNTCVARMRRESARYHTRRWKVNLLAYIVIAYLYYIYCLLTYFFSFWFLLNIVWKSKEVYC